MALGYGGIAMVSRAFGLSAHTIRAGMAELAETRSRPIAFADPAGDAKQWWTEIRRS